MIINEVRMRPSVYGFTCYLSVDGREYVGHGSTMEVAYEAFIQYGNAALAEEKGLTHFEARVFNINAASNRKRAVTRQGFPKNYDSRMDERCDYSLTTIKLSWWKRLIKAIKP